MQAWCPTTWGVVSRIGNVQPMTTGLVPRLRVFTDGVRMAILGLFSGKRRRWRGDLIWVFKSLKGIARLDPNNMFTLRPPCNKRGHSLTLLKPMALTAARANPFAVRVISPWSKFSQKVIGSSSDEVFKRR